MVGVDFETEPKTVIRRKREDPLQNYRGDTMHMMTVATEDIAVSAFFDLGGRLLATPEEKRRFTVYLHTVKIAFEQLFLQTLLDLRKYLNLNMSHPQDIETVVLDTSLFKDFSIISDQIGEKIFGGMDALAGVKLKSSSKSDKSQAAGSPTNAGASTAHASNTGHDGKSINKTTAVSMK